MNPKPGDIVKLPDGRIGTVVYNGLDGWGIMWGIVDVDINILTSACPLFGKKPDNYPYITEAMLRESYPSAIKNGLECVGREFEIIDDSRWKEHIAPKALKGEH